MEPLAALGVAAAAVQFFEFSKNLLKDVKALRDAQYGHSFQSVFEAAKQLAGMKNTLQYQPRLKFNETKEVSEQRKALGELFSRCAAVAVELMDFLGNLRQESKKHKLAELQNIFKAKEIIERIRGFEANINASQSQLTIRLLAYMNAKFDASSFHHDAKLTQVQDDQSKVMEIVALAQERIIGASVDNSDRVLAAVLKLTGGGTMMITQGKDSIVDSGSYGLNRLRMLTLRSGPSENQHTASLSNSPNAIVWPVLNRLKFRHIKDRYDTVKMRHDKTLEWVFESEDSNSPWSPFPSWLKSDGICYWVNGKPGSGKTTLMKFINQDARTQSLALSWAKQTKDGAPHSRKRVLLASFFFWNLGPFSIQKSQSGLLRALLHDILEQEPTLIPKVVPELCFDIMESKVSSEISEPSLQELQRWFKRLLQAACPTTRLCFLIDGFDEYSGNLDELVDVLLGEPNRFVKFIVSSRPTIPCTDAFSRYPSLRLQDLTQGDIRNYAEEVFNQTPSDLKNIVDSEGLSAVIEEITKRSSGVFLWVVLVVRSLLGGIKNGDSIAELLIHLRKLPTDLADLYGQILNSIPSDYRSQAANFFRIMTQSVEYEVCGERPYPVSALRMSFAEEPYDIAINTDMKGISTDEVLRRSALIDRRIRSRCCGLLEVNSRATTSVDYVSNLPKLFNTLGRSQPYTACTLFVEFIHRSVVEFFADTQELTRLSSGDTYTTHDPWVSLFCSHILILKTTNPNPTFLSLPNRNNIFLSMITNALVDALHAEDSGSPLQFGLLDEFDRAVSYHCDRGSEAHIEHPMIDIDDTSHWVNLLIHVVFGDVWDRSMDLMAPFFNALGFRGIAILLPLPSYIDAWLEAETFDAQTAGETCTKLLHGWALAKLKSSFSPLDSSNEGKLLGGDLKDNLTWRVIRHTLLRSPWTSSNTRLVKVLLESGADPNRQIGDNPSAFHVFLCLTVAYQVHDEASAFHVRRMLELFVSYGVTADQVFPRHQWFEDRLFQFARRVSDLTRTSGLGTWTTVEYVKFVEDHYKKLARKGVKVGNLEGIQSIVLGSAPGAMSQLPRLNGHVPTRLSGSDRDKTETLKSSIEAEPSLGLISGQRQDSRNQLAELSGLQILRAAGTLSCENIQKKSSETTSVGRTGGVSVVERSWSRRLLSLCSGRRK